MARKLGWTLFALVIGVASGLWLSRASWQKTHELQSQTRDAKAEMNAALAKQAELAGKKARYESPAGREELARERGMLPPNERPLDLNR